MKSLGLLVQDVEMFLERAALNLGVKHGYYTLGFITFFVLLHFGSLLRFGL